MSVDATDRNDNQPMPEQGHDHIKVGNITESKAIAIGPGATAVYQGLSVEEVAALLVALKDQEEQQSIVAAKPRYPFEPEMVLVPAGSFLMGDDNAPFCAPQTTVTLPAYLIGQFPITNEQFGEYIQQTGQLAGRNLLWDGNRPPRDRLRHPVVGVTWQEALAYCDWLRATTERPYTLPNEAQWEKAARSADGRLFPWGSSWEQDRCNTEFGVVKVVDAYPPQSAYGCYDMVGNAREWTSTLWGDSPQEPDSLYAYPWAADGRRDNLHTPPTTRRIFRGGCGENQRDYQCSRRGHYAPTRSGPRQQRHGFRVVIDETTL